MVNQQPRRIGVMIGSDSDLPQCGEGLCILRKAVDEGKATVATVLTQSIHRNTAAVLDELRDWTRAKLLDVLITGAGMANHLTGMADAYLRYTLRDQHIVVVGVAFAHAHPFAHEAAKLSINQVPGSQVIWWDSEGQFVGSEGFRRACVYAVEASLPIITLPEPRRIQRRTLDEAIELAYAGKLSDRFPLSW